MGLCSRELTRRAEIHLWAPRRPGWWVARGSSVLRGFWLCRVAKRSHKDSTGAKIVQHYGLMSSSVPCATERERACRQSTGRLNQFFSAIARQWCQQVNGRKVKYQISMQAGEWTETNAGKFICLQALIKYNQVLALQDVLIHFTSSQKMLPMLNRYGKTSLLHPF